MSRWDMYDETDWTLSPDRMSEITTAAIEDEHRLYDTPVMSAHMRRDDERLWINAYPGAAIVTLTYPAAPVGNFMGSTYPRVVRVLPVSPGVELSEVFAQAFMTAESNDWQPAPVNEEA